MKKNLFTLVCSICLALVLAALLLPACAAEAPTPVPTPTPTPTPTLTPTIPEVITLKYAEISPQAEIGRQSTSAWMCEEIEKRTNGRVKMEMYWGGTLVEAKTALYLLQKGVCDLTVTPQGWYPVQLSLSMLPAFSSWPADIIKNGQDCFKLYDEFPELQEVYKRFNARMFTMWPYEGYEIISTKPIRNLADLKGMKICFTALEAFAEAAGVVNVPVLSVDAYTGLQRGIIDGFCCNLDAFTRYKHYEVAKYLTQGLSFPKYCIEGVINLDTWNELPTDIQKIIIEVGKENSDLYAQMQLDARTEALELYKSEGVEIIQFPGEDKDEWFSRPEVLGLRNEWLSMVEKQGWMCGPDLMARWLEYCGE